MQCAILVGGIGSRLGHLVEDNPKPLLPIDGTPFLEILMRELMKFGFKHFILLAGYKSEKLQNFVTSSPLIQDHSLTVDISIEDDPLGTAGCLLNAEKYLDDEFLLVNGDSFFNLNVLKLMNFHHSQKNSVGTIALRNIDDASRYGTVTIQNNQIISFAEKKSIGAGGLINAGLYWLNKKILSYIPKGNASLEQDVFPKLVQKGLLFGQEYSGFFIDIGIPADFKSAQSLIPKALKRPAVFFDRDGVLNYDDGYTHKIADFKWKPHAKEAIKFFNSVGYSVFIVTNQAGIARGIYTVQQMHLLHQWMRNDLVSDSAYIDDIEYCPHHIDGTILTLSHHCHCRKPKPGMLEALAKKWPIDLDRSFLIGDKKSDIDAATAFGIKSYLFQDENLLTISKNMCTDYNGGHDE